MTTRSELIREIIVQSYKYSITEYRGVLWVPIKAIKRKVMKKLKLKSKGFDLLLLSKGQPLYYEDGLSLGACGSRQTSHLNYITSNPEQPKFTNSYCFFLINSKIAKKLLNGRTQNE